MIAFGTVHGGAAFAIGLYQQMDELCAQVRLASHIGIHELVFCSLYLRTILFRVDYCAKHDKYAVTVQRKRLHVRVNTDVKLMTEKISLP